MDFVLEGIAQAFDRILSGDPDTLHAVYVSLLCTVTSVAIAFVLAVPYGAWLGLKRKRGHPTQVFLMRIGTFVPTVVIGVLVYALLSRRGPLGSMDMLYTKRAIIFGEVLLAFPLIGVLAHGAAAGLDRRVYETARTLGASPIRALFAALGEVREMLVAAFLLAFARCLSELGIALAVGGNLRQKTRTLPTTITYELRRGEFAAAVACGLILLALAVVTALVAHRMSREDER